MERRSRRDRDDDDRDDDRGSRGRDRASRSRDDDDDDRGSSRRGRDRDDDRGGRGRSSGRSFSYERRSREDVEKRANQGAGDFDRFLADGVKTFKPSDKENEVRFLPPTWSGAKHFAYDIWVHYGIGPDRQTYLCPHKMKGEACPVCEEREDALRKGDDEYAKELEPKRRALAYLVDRQNEKEGVLAWAMPWTIDKDIVKVMVDKKTGEVLPIDHPEEGYDVTFDKEGKGDRTKYSGLAIARRESDLGNDKWLDFAVDNPLPDQLIFYDYEHIAKAFGGASGGSHRSKRDRDDDDGEGNSRRSSRREEPARKSRDEEDDDRRGRTSESRSRSRDDDDDIRGRASSRGGRSTKEDDLGWDAIHEMTGSELEALIEEKDLDINPDKAESDEDLADWICEELGVKKEARRTRVRADADDGDERAGRLAEMRRKRGD